MNAMEPITPETRLKPSPDVLFSQVGDEAVLLNRASGIYYSLDRVGTLVWAEIVAGAPLGHIQSTVLRQFSVAFDVVWADLAALVSDLAAKGLVTVLRVEE
jgi:hypothetical protein